MPYSQSWLEANSSVRLVLVEVLVNLTSGGTQAMYFSNRDYATTLGDIIINSNISGGLSFSENIDLEGKISVTYGSVDLTNNGDYEYLITNSTYIWPNSVVNIYYGDTAFVCSNLAQIKTDFKLIFSSVVDDISVKRNKISIRLVDKLQRLNQPISETKLGVYGTWGTGAQTNADTLLPIVFGEVFNVSPMLINPATLEYVVGSGINERLIEVRDNGVPVSLAADTTATDGRFKLASPAVGTITASVQGTRQSVVFTSTTVSSASTTYSNNIASIIATIVTQYGAVASQRFTLAEIDTANFYGYYIGSTQPIGIYITDRANTLQVCNDIVASIGGQIFCTREGLLQILILGVPTSDAVVAITTSDMLSGTFDIVDIIKPVAANKLGYAKNWTVQEGLVTAIPTEHKTSYATEWLTVTNKNTTVATNYKQSSDTVQEDTYLLVAADASTESVRRNNYFSAKHTVYSFTGTAKLLSLKLGQSVTITYPRYGLTSPTTGQVIGLSPNWLKGTIDVEVII